MMAWPLRVTFLFRSPPRKAGLCLWLLILASLPAAELHRREMPRNPSSAKECAICHYRWVDTFFVDGRGTDLAPLQTEQVEGTSEMCFSCHDGSVLDSRWSFEKDRGHQSGVPPPPGVRLPDYFPLDAQGKMQCVTCHSAHGVSSLPGQPTSTFLRVNNTNSSICLICHPTMAGNLAGHNHPLGPVTNAVPQELWKKHATPESAGQTIICETCHTPHRSAKEILLKQTVSDSALCLTCHLDKNPVSPDGTRNFFHVVNAIPTNAIIPATLLTNGARVGKNGALTCLTCHKIHQNRIEQHLLTAKLDAQSTFCFLCHADKQGLLHNQHNLTEKFPDTRNLAGQTVAQSGPCSACHLPHQNARLPAGSGNSATAFCLSCHGASGLAAKTNLLGRGHPVDIPLPTPPTGTAPQPISLPLYDAARQLSVAGNIVCVTCHDPHRPPVEGSPLLSAKLLRTPVSSLCQECHAHQANILNSKHDLSGTTPAVSNVLGQAAAVSGACSTCHLLHSPNDSTWAQPGLSAAPPTEKCRVCHRPDGLAAKKVIQDHSHPMDITLEASGLHTTLPLFPTNAPGKMTCLTCHDPHQWSPGEATIVDSHAEGNAQNSFLRLPASPAPALCANCHPKEALVMGTDHDLSWLLPGSTNTLGQTTAEAGPCGACHLSHQGPIKAKMWAQELRQPSPNTPLVDAMCRACHSPRAIAANKAPMFSYHPPVTIVQLPPSSGYDRTFFPLFDPVSGQQINAGQMACSSCHNVHQWSLGSPNPGPGHNLEGDSNNSFLRHRSADLPCKICHGLDAIYRYQYYHKSTTHQAPDNIGLDDLF